MTSTTESVNSRNISSVASSSSAPSPPPHHLRCDKPPSRVPPGSVLLATLFSTLGCVNFGYCIGWTAPALPSIANDDNFPALTDSEVDWISSILTLGAILGTLIGADLSDRIGRQLTLLLTAIPCNLGWIAICAASDSSLLLVGRSLLGISIGMMNTACPPFIVEICPPAHRGLMGGAFQVGVNTGLCLVYLAGALLPWRVLSLVGLVFGSVMGLGLMFVRESPFWLLRSGRFHLYEQSCVFYSQQVTDFHSIASFAANEKPRRHTRSRFGTLKTLLKQPDMFKPLLLCVFLSLAFQLSAVTVISFYTVDMFHSAGVTHAHEASVCLGIAQLVIGVMGSLSSTRLPRKQHYLTTSFMTSAGLCAIAICYLVKDDYRDTLGMSIGVTVAFVYTISVFAFGAGTITWAYVGELLPAKGTGLVVGVASLTNWVVSFVLTFSFTSMKAAMNDFGVFFFYAVCHFFCTVVLIWLPETRGRSLIEIQQHFQNNNTKYRSAKNIPGSRSAPLLTEHTIENYAAIS